MRCPMVQKRKPYEGVYERVQVGSGNGKGDATILVGFEEVFNRVSVNLFGGDWKELWFFLVR